MSRAMLFPAGRSRALALALALVLVATLAFAARADAVPKRFWGVVPQTTLDSEQVERLNRGGVDSMRVSFDWSAMQPRRNGPIDWGGPDAVIENAALNGVELLPTVTGAPSWAVPWRRVPGGGGAEAPVRLPINGAAAKGWRILLRQAVLRYGPKGSFWRENGDLPKRPIHFWQIGNEPNFKYFVAKPNAAEYGKLVMRSYAALRSVDRGARVVLAGLFAEPRGCRTQKRPLSPCAVDFLDQMYRTTPGLKRRFVGASLHPYTGTWQTLKPQIEEFREVLADNRDAGKGLWLTELGWSSQRPEPRRNVFAKGINGQRNQLKGAFSLLEREQRPWRIKRTYWFSVEDVQDACNFCDGSGLFTEGFKKPKKSWYAYVRFAGGRAG